METMMPPSLTLLGLLRRFLSIAVIGSLVVVLSSSANAARVGAPIDATSDASALTGEPLESDPLYEVETIRSFVSVITAHRDRSLTVTETITYDFSTELRHGIYRDIPFATRSGIIRFDTPLKILSVTRGGVDEPFSVQSNGLRKRIRIGAPDAYVKGVQEYQLTYSVRDVIRTTDTGIDELAWNVTGDEWPAQIIDSMVFVEMTENPEAEITQWTCYIGSYGSTEEGCLHRDDPFALRTPRVLEIGEGWSVGVGWAAGTFDPAPTIGKFLRDNYYLFFPLVVFVIVLIFFLRKGKDSKDGTVIPWYEAPEGLSAPEVGVMVDQKVDRRDISAGMMELATRGFAGMKFAADGSVTISKKEGDVSTLSPVLQEIYRGLFKSSSEVNLGDMKGSFLTTYQAAERLLYTSLTDTRKFFVKNPQAVRGAWIGWGIFLAIAGIAMMIIRGSQELTFIEYVWPLVGSGIVLMIFGAKMPKYTRAGQRAREHVLGFKWFLSVTETERLKFHNAPEKKPEQFMALLPFAIALGVEKQWADQFKDMQIDQPSWVSGNWTLWSPLVFADQTSHISHELGGAITTPSSSGSGFSGGGGGGGGFSGGGFGGGGGGSW